MSIAVELQRIPTTGVERTVSYKVIARYGEAPQCAYQREIIGLTEDGEVASVAPLPIASLDVLATLPRTYSITRGDGSTLSVTGAEYVALTAQIFDMAAEEAKGG